MLNTILVIKLLNFFLNNVTEPLINMGMNFVYFFFTSILFILLDQGKVESTYTYT